MGFVCIAATRMPAAYLGCRLTSKRVDDAGKVAPMSRMLKPCFSLLIGLILLAGALPQATPSAVDAEPASLIVPVAPPAPPAPDSFNPITFDDFNRTVASGWGTSSSGVDWTDDSFRQTGVTSEQAGNTMSVDGLNGRLDLGILEPVFMRAGSGPWQEHEWTMTARFRFATLPSAGDDLEINYWIFKDAPAPYADAERLALVISPDQAGGHRGRVRLTGTVGDPNSVSVDKSDWQAGISYTVKWGFTWGGQSKAKVWPSANPEPASWLLFRDAGLDTFTTGVSTVLEVEASPANGAETVWFDEIRYDPGNLFVEPPPPGTEELENGTTAADPVQTFSGAFLYHHADVSIPGRGPAISFARANNRADTRVGPLGPGWTHSYNTRLTEPGDGTADVLVVRPDGNTDRFQANPNGTYSAPAAVYSTLTRSTDGIFVLTEKDQTSWTFDPSGRLTLVADRFGNASALTYNNQGQVLSIADPAGRGSLTLGYTNGRLTTITDWATPARAVTYQYDATGRLWKVTDREGKTTTFAYDGTSARIATITDARSHVALTLTYDAQGRVATQKDARGLTTGDVTTLGYVVNPDGTRVTTITEPVTSFELAFHPTVEDTYNASGWLTQRVSRPSSTEILTENYTYDATGNRTSITDPRGDRSDYCYDVNYAGTVIGGSRGNLTRRIEPPPTAGANRPVSLLAYDTTDNVVQTVAPKGVPSGQTVTCATDLSAITTAYATDFTYDGSGTNLLSITRRFTDPDTGLKTAIMKYEYGDAANPGSVTKVIPPRGNTGPSPDYTYATTFTYFGSGPMAGLLASTADALSDTTTLAYDAVGRVTSTVDPLGNAPGGVPAEHTTTFGYDNEDRTRFVRLPAPVAGGAQLVTETRYDEVGNPTVRIDANGQVTTYAYDERDGLFQVKESPTAWTDPASPPAGVITTEYAYDAAGNLTRLTRAKGDAANERATDYTFDGRGLVRQETQYPSWPTTTPTLVTTNAYDPDGNLTTSVDPLGRTATSGHDALNRRTAIDYADPGTLDVAYGYDANGNRTSMTDGTGVTSYVYDESDRLTSVTSPGPKTVGYRYDLDGNRTKVIYPDSTAVAYTFNKASQLTSLSDWASRSVAYTYWPDGLVKTATNPDTSVATYSYDNARRSTDILSQVGSTTITHHAYTLDPVGNVTALAEFVSGLTQGPTAWSSAVRLNPDDGLSQVTPALTMGADDTAYAVWGIGGFNAPDRDIFFSLRDPSTGAWTAQQRVNNVTAGDQFDPDIAVDGAGNAYAVWTDPGASDRNIFFSKRSAATGTWSPSVRINDDPVNKTPEQRSPAIAVRSNGDAIAVWRDLRGNKENIYAARLPAGSSTWSTNMKVTTNSNTTKFTTDVAFGPDGTAYAVWDEPRTGDTNVWFASLPPGSSTWSANTKISDDPGTAIQFLPKIAVDGAGNLVVTWQDERTSPAQARVRRRPAGSSIWAPSTVVASNALNPVVAVRADGRASLTWTEPAGSVRTVWASEYDPASGTWAPKERISDPTAANTDSPQAAIGTSVIVIAWTNSHDVPGFGTESDIVAKAKSFTGGGTDTFAYGYDRLSRLTSVAGPDGNPTYGYDPLGNRTSKILAGTTAYTYDRADRITTAGATSITVDANGNTTAKGADAFTYDQANRLKTATVSGTTETYAYDGDGVRFSRQVGGGSPIRYVSDVNRSLPVPLDDGTRKYVYGLGLAYAVSGSTLEVYHTDRLGSVRAITNGTGVVTAAYRTDEFGISTATSGSSSQPFGYTGEPRDATGLSYLRARYYDPSLGRFVSRDALVGNLRSCQTLNRYAYVGNNPTTATDPSGLGTSVVLDFTDLLPCDLGKFFFGLGLVLGGSLEAATGIVALPATFGLSSLGSYIAITSGAATTVVGSYYVYRSWDCTPSL
jgi:RHS repeat-associated protein